MAEKDYLNSKPPKPNPDATINETKLLQTGKGATDARAMDILSRTMGYGGVSSSIVDTLYGNNILGTAPVAPNISEHQGLVFITRPLLNLSYHNIRNAPSFTHMLGDNTKSNARYVQAMLDPLGDHTCPFVDPLNPFMPLLGNTLISLSGWQEPILNNWTSAPDRLQGQITLGDSSTAVHGSYPLSATFRNIRGNPLTYLFHIWVNYIGLVKEGKLDPYPEFMAYNTVDYQSRFYRLILDPSRRFVEELTANFVCHPNADRAAVRADFNDSGPHLKESDTYSQTFQSTGAAYFDPRMMYDFNETSAMFNPTLADANLRKTHMRRLWPQEYSVLSYRAYPLINTVTAELEWWISKEVHALILGKVNYPGYQS